MVAEAIGGSGQQSTDDNNKQECCNKSTNEIILEAELDQEREGLQDMQEKESYAQKHYTVSEMSAEVLRMETGLATKEVFNIVVLHALRFKDCIVYYTGWNCLSKFLGALLTFTYFLLQGKILCFARVGMSLASCIFPKRSEDLVQKIISPVIFDTNCSFKQ